MSAKKCPHPATAEKYTNGRCKICTRARAKAYAEANPDRYKKIKRKYYELNSDAVKARSRKRELSKLPTPTRPAPEHCECCGKHRRNFNRRFALDHCHVTGVFRGWLCHLCNIGMGALGDSLEGLANAERYLKRVYQ